MSKGHGRIQRAILHAFAQNKLATSIDLACDIFGVNPVPAARVETVNRALRKLIAEGLVRDVGRQQDGRRLLAFVGDGAFKGKPPLWMMSDRYIGRAIQCSPYRAGKLAAADRAKADGPLPE